MTDKKNKALNLRKKILIILFSLIPAVSVLIIFIYLSLKYVKNNTLETVIFISALIFINFSVSVLIFFKALKILKPLTECTLFDSTDINRVIANNTAPVKKKYYMLYNNAREIESKSALLRRNLEKIYIKLQENKKRSLF